MHEPYYIINMYIIYREILMQHVAIFFMLILVAFSGCSQSTTPQPSPQKNELSLIETDTENNSDAEKISDTEDEIDDDNDGFEEEFSTEKTETHSDPLSGYNRSMTNFNDKVYTYALNPVAEAYAYVIPQPLRIGLSNFIKNLNFPVRLANNLLQGKMQNVSDETGRFLANSTIGLLGVMDPATSYLHIPAHVEDFGQTLGYYGVGPGFHIVLPFLGPSNLRDLAGISVDAYASPLINIHGLERYKIPKNWVESTGIVAIHMINKTSLNLGQYESIKKDALDLYPFLRDIYEQKRVSDIAE